MRDKDPKKDGTYDKLGNSINIHTYISLFCRSPYHALLPNALRRIFSQLKVDHLSKN